MPEDPFASIAKPVDDPFATIAKPIGSEPPTPSLYDRVGNVYRDYNKGLFQGAGQTVGTVAGLLNKIPFLGETLAPSQGVQALKTISTPETLPAKAGVVAEQVGEMMATGGPLKAGAQTLATKLPWLGRAAAPLMRVGAEALNTGTSAALHGQPVGPSAAIGGGGAAVGEVGQLLAPKLAESALGVTQRFRGHGRTIGEAALGETSAIRPAAMASQASGKLASLTSELEARADAAGQAGATGSTKPALDYLDTQIAKFQARNSPLAEKLQAVRDQLTKNSYTGQAIPQDLSPRALLELKRGVGDTINTWEPQLKKTVNPMAQRVYGLLDSELDRTVPGAADLNQRMSSLIPVRQRAQAVSNSASLTQKAANRLARPTGAMAASLVGGGVGYHKGGIPGAVAGGAAGLVLPEALASPTAQMAAARLIQSGVAPYAARAMVAQQKPTDDYQYLDDPENWNRQKKF
jgi:hypothetical protein